jgi:NAD(P)-dependent dehydrogenase (short-subunit alcohol dehydrogenase family)
MKYTIVTGAYGAIGKAIAAGVAAKGFAVTLVARDEGSLQSAVGSIIHKTGNREVKYHVVDLGRSQSIIEFAASWKGPLHLLINNAATSPRKRTETPEGIEVQFATNVLGYFRMIQNLHPFMKGQEDARIVNVASYWAGGLDFNDLEFRKRSYDNDASYRLTKQANRMLTVAFAERLKPFRITVNSCHPGDVNSKLSNSLGFGGHESPEEGADTPVWLGTDPSVKGISGKYFEHRKMTSCSFSKDLEAVERLYRVCEGY